MYRGARISGVGRMENTKWLFAQRGRIVIYQAAELSSIPTHALDPAVHRLEITGNDEVVPVLSAVLLCQPALCFLAEVVPNDTHAGNSKLFTKLSFN